MKEMDGNIQYLSGVGPKRAALLTQELGISTIGELLHFYPFRYVDRSTITPIREVIPDTANIQIQARVIQVALINRTQKTVLVRTLADNADGYVDTGLLSDLKFNTISRMTVMVEDSSGKCELVFFRGIKYTFNKLLPGRLFLFFGKPTLFQSRLQFTHPEIDYPVQMEEPSQGEGSQPHPVRNASQQEFRGMGLTGVYASTDKLKNAGLTGRQMNKLMANALRLCINEIEETLPDYVLKENGLVNLRFALCNIHFPKDAQSLKLASYRLKFEELLYLQLSLLKQKYVRSRNENGIRMPHVGEAFNQCYQSLPYDLTGAQKRVIKEIRADLTSGRQMNRLLQGDVGSGKTLVAVMSALLAVGNGYQACIMAPTEVLAQQHYANIQKYLAPTGRTVRLLTGSTKTKERKEILPALAEGSIDIIVGTHALIEDNVIFKHLGLAIIDEQHRFGVEQRARLWNKTPGAIVPHILVMTATPIPRTLAMTLYGDLDVSVIDEMPPGRKPVQTLLITERKRSALYKFMKEQIRAGHQVFVVYPLIFESEKMDYRNLEEGYNNISDAFPLPEYKVAIVHGKQTNEDKNFNMSAFAAGRADILVSTTVIEVGVDVPNASVMVIESAERFGLSQLHQLRGRVGRGSAHSYCILVKGDKVSKESQKRLELMCSTEDGFVLAEEDMKMRGPGDLEGTQQSGLPIALNIASLSKDSRILSEAHKYADYILQKDSDLHLPENAVLARELRKEKYQVKDYSQIS